MLLHELRSDALEIFRRTLADIDAARAVGNFVSRDGERLRVANAEYDLREGREVYVIAIGKAAGGMARAVDELLADRIRGGILTAPAGTHPALSSAWQTFAGGHPVPNEASLAAGRRALKLLDAANHAQALIIFLISGGGSAMLEAPLNARITLDDLRAANELLVTCGATIDEVNFLRGRFSAVKGGRLAARAPRARQVTLIISDTNPGSPEKVASGPSLIPAHAAHDASALLREYDLDRRLPFSIRDAILNAPAADDSPTAHPFHVLLDHSYLIRRAAHHAEQRGFQVHTAPDLVEQPVGEGAAELVRRLMELRRAVEAGTRVCLVSAGEFRCPVRGQGRGGRNSETVLRALVELDKQSSRGHVIVLSAGTDGIDGNSPAAGAIGDESTLRRARERGLDAESFLQQSDSYTFFSHLDDAIITGATGTNVRDLRVLLA